MQRVMNLWKISPSCAHRAMRMMSFLNLRKQCPTIKRHISKSRSLKGSNSADISSPNSMSMDYEFYDPQLNTEVQHQRPKRLKRPTKNVNENLEPEFTVSPSVVQAGNQHLPMSELNSGGHNDLLTGQ